jgi:hypothetical protein
MHPIHACITIAYNFILTLTTRNIIKNHTSVVVFFYKNKKNVEAEKNIKFVDECYKFSNLKLQNVSRSYET